MRTSPLFFQYDIASNQHFGLLCTGWGLTISTQQHKLLVVGRNAQAAYSVITLRGYQSAVLSFTILSHHTYAMNASAKNNTISMRFRLVPAGLGKLQHEQKCCFVAEISHGIPLHQPTKHCSGNVQVWIGYNQSLRPCQSGLTLNMDITAAAFLEGQPMLQLIATTVGMQNISGGLNPGQARSINEAMRLQL